MIGMAANRPSEQDWAMRTAIYEYFVEHASAPTHVDMAAKFGVASEDARASFHRLDAAHALFLDPGSSRIRILNPFSNVPTPFGVEIAGRRYFANCAWDMLAIPAMLGRDALIEARLEVAERRIQIPVVDGQPKPDEEYLINYSVPFRDWYANLIHT